MDRVDGSKLMTAIGGTPRSFADSAWAVDRISIDSRTLQPGDIFWAVRGEKFDGHDFTAKAFDRGAAACVIHRERANEITGPAILVDDTQRALRNFARWYREQQDAMVIGVTGSFGKTTTREMIHSALSAEHSGMRSAANWNNEIGLPLSLLDIELHHEFAVLEMGASRVGDIAALATIASPEVGVITGIGPAHLQGFGSLDGVVRGKGELLEALPVSGFAILPGDDPLARNMAQRASCPVIFVGESADDDVRADDVIWTPGGLSFRVDETCYDIPVLGRHFLTSALIAIAIGREIGMAPAAIATGLRSFQPVAGRCQPQRIGEWTVIHDAYNANPQSMAAACRLLSDWPGPAQRIMILGDMLELGGDSARYHYELGRTAAESEIDRLIVCGQFSGEVVRGAIAGGMSSYRISSADDWSVTTTVLDCWLEPDDVILIKGSRGMQMERVIDWLKAKVANNSAEPRYAVQRIPA